MDYLCLIELGSRLRTSTWQWDPLALCMCCRAASNSKRNEHMNIAKIYLTPVQKRVGARSCLAIHWTIIFSPSLRFLMCKKEQHYLKFRFVLVGDFFCQNYFQAKKEGKFYWPISLPQPRKFHGLIGSSRADKILFEGAGYISKCKNCRHFWFPTVLKTFRMQSISREVVF